MDPQKSIYQVHNSSTRYKLERSFYTNYAFPLHMHSDIELIFLLEGQLDVMVDGKRYSLNENELLFVFPNQLHSFFTERSSHCCILVFSQDLIPTLCMAISNKACMFPIIKATNQLKILLDYLIACDQLSLLSVQGNLYKIFSQLESSCFVPAQTMRDQSLLHRILIYCIEHYRENITLKQFAHEHGYNTNYCSHCFHSATLMNFREFVNLIRIQQSKQLLLETSSSITEIAFECGFQSVRSFNRAFLDTTSVSPREYRLHYVANNSCEKFDDRGVHQIFMFNPMNAFEKQSVC